MSPWRRTAGTPGHRASKYSDVVHVTAVKIEGIKGFPGGDGRVDLSFETQGRVPRWIVVAGRNGSGKSTLLRAIALAVVGPKDARQLAGTFRGWIRDEEQRAQVSVGLRHETTVDRFTGPGRPVQANPLRVALAWERGDGPEPVLAPAPAGGPVWSPERGPWADNPQGWFTAGYGPFRRLSAAPTEAQRLMMLPGRPAGLASLFREDASLSESVAWLKDVYLRRLEGNTDAAALEGLVLDLLGDGLLPDGMAVERVTSEGLWVKPPDGRALPLDAVSDGYRTVAGFVLDLVKQLSETFGRLRTDVVDGRTVVLEHGLVLVDEIDVHLHVEWQKRIGFWLKDHFPQIQFIVTTHSPFICQAADPGGLIRLSPAWCHGRSAEIVQAEVFARVVNGGADDAVLSELFGLESTMSAPALDLRRRLSLLEVELATRPATDDDRRRLADLRSQLPTSQAEIAVRRAITAGWDAS